MKINNIKIFLIIGLIIVFAIGWKIFLSYQKKSVEQNKKEQLTNVVSNIDCVEFSTGKIVIGAKTLLVDIAGNPCQQELGLSGRKNLKDGTGMLFVFDKVGNYGFWMKDMLFAIDILWIDSDFKIVGAVENVAPETYPNVFGKNYKAKYVLEVSSGFISENNLRVGNKIIFYQNN